MKLSTLLSIGTLVLLSACNFRDPDDGYDPNWKPDHNEQKATSEEESGPAEAELAQGDDMEDLSSSSTGKRPSQITADTAGMKKVWDTWEMVGVEKSEYTAYFQKKEIAMIVEQTPSSTRSYYFDGGALFYFNEISEDGLTSLTVEFDDIGDVIGARKSINGQPADPEGDDYSEIVEHAVELKIAAEN